MLRRSPLLILTIQSFSWNRDSRSAFPPLSNLFTNKPRVLEQSQHTSDTQRWSQIRHSTHYCQRTQCNYNHSVSCTCCFKDISRNQETPVAQSATNIYYGNHSFSKNTSYFNHCYLSRQSCSPCACVYYSNYNSWILTLNLSFTLHSSFWGKYNASICTVSAYTFPSLHYNKLTVYLCYYYYY